MNIKQQYIVLFARDRKTTLGFVKLTFRGEQVKIFARAAVHTEAEVALILKSETQRISIPMQPSNGVYETNETMRFDGVHVVAAVTDANGLLALGANGFPKANWHDYDKPRIHEQEDTIEPIRIMKKEATSIHESGEMGLGDIDYQSEFKQEDAQDLSMPEPAKPETEKTNGQPNVRRPLNEEQTPLIDEEPCPIEEEPLQATEEPVWQTQAYDSLYDRPPYGTQAGRQADGDEAESAFNPTHGPEPKEQDNGPSYDARMPKGRPYVMPPPIHAVVQETARFQTEVKKMEIKLRVEGPYAQIWKWRQVSSKEKGYSYLLGEAEQNGRVVAVAVAVPGEYAPQPPANLQGFSVFRSGYWLLAQDVSTGERIPI